MRRVPGRTGYDAPVAVVPGRAAFIQAKVTVMEQASFVSRVARGQWSFFWAGIVFGIAQIIYMATLWIQVWQAGGVAESTPITVTTDLGKMFRAMEMFLYRLFGLPDFQLYGNSVDGIASGGAVVPGVGWPIVGMVVGGYFVARLERENRTWVRYSPRILAISFFGGVLFSYGTRLAGVGIIRCADLESGSAGTGREGTIGPFRPVLGRTRRIRGRLVLLAMGRQRRGDGAGWQTSWKFQAARSARRGGWFELLAAANIVGQTNKSDMARVAAEGRHPWRPGRFS